MNTRLLVSLAALVGLFVCASADPVLLNENFSGGALNASAWSSSEPFSDSNVDVSGGALHLTNGGGVLSTGNYAAPIEVLFSFAFTGGSYDSFGVYTRADGFHNNGYGIKKGIGVTFRIKEDTGNLNGNISIWSNDLVLASGTFGLTPNTFYSGRFVDNGSAVGFYWGSDLIPFLTATNSDHFGDKVATFNREGAGNNSHISAGSQMAVDYITVLDLDPSHPRARVPESGDTLIYFCTVALVFILARFLVLGGLTTRRR